MQPPAHPSPTSDADTPSDAELMARTGAGDTEAFRLLVERHQNLVRGVVFRMTSNANDVEDLSQQIFLRVWKAAGRYRPEAKFTTWLMTITRNLVFNECRSKSRWHWLSLDAPEPPAQVLALHEPSERAPDEVAQQTELRAIVDSAIASLPEKQRLALVLHRFEGLPHEEVAAILNTTVSATKSLIFRAREALKQSLAGHLDDR